SRLTIRVDRCGFMTALLRSWRTMVLACAAVALVFAASACRKRGKSNANANTGATSLDSNDPEQAKRNAQSLVDQGKELYKNDQEEQAVEKFKQAIDQDPNNAEAHVRLGMSYAALGNKDDAEAEYKKSVELFKKKIQNDPK